MPHSHSPHRPAAITLQDARLEFGGRFVWDSLSFKITPGEFIAVLGPNGSGKTSLLHVLLGLQPLTHGHVRISGHRAQRGDHRIGYIPQQRAFDADLPLRGRDLVQLGLNGHQFGFKKNAPAARIDEALARVGAGDYANQPLGVLSGGEQQRLRVAQALVGRPDILLCDEPLLSLDPSSQQSITKLINDYRHDTGATVLFVTHEVNPVLSYVDRILYLTNGRWALDTPDKILESKTLSELYGAPVDVLRVHGHVHVIADETALTETGEHHHEESRSWN